MSMMISRYAVYPFSARDATITAVWSSYDDFPFYRNKMSTRLEWSIVYINWMKQVCYLLHKNTLTPTAD